MRPLRATALAAALLPALLLPAVALADRPATLPTRDVAVTYRTLGNVGPASIPITLAQEAEHLHRGDRVLLCGVGSGINTSMLELAW